MEILPIGSLSDTDKIVFGLNLYNLSLLKRLDFPVLPGIVISPPEIILQTVLKYVQEGDREIFEQKLTIIKNEIAKIPIPSELETKLINDHRFFLKGEVYSKKENLWNVLLNIWLDEIKVKIWHMGLSIGTTQNLSAQAIFFIKDKCELGTAFFDPQKDDVIISFESKLSPGSLNAIDKMVLAGNKKLYIPQIYNFVIHENKILLVSLIPFTQSLPLSNSQDIVLPLKPKIAAVKQAIKLFLNLANGFAIDSDIDGLIIEGQQSRDFDELVFKLCEGALSFPGKPVIYQLSDVDDGELSGSLRLLHRKEEFKSACEALLFVRNKKNLLNIELAIPKVSSPLQLQELKKELNLKGISRKGTLKFWLELSVPENIINIDKYLESGIDGIILDLDSLQKLLIDNPKNQPDLIKIHVSTIIKFIDPVFKILHQEKIPVLAKGSLILHPDVLDLLIDKGTFGIIVNTLYDANNLPEHLSWMENRLVQKRIPVESEN